MVERDTTPRRLPKINAQDVSGSKAHNGDSAEKTGENLPGPRRREKANFHSCEK